MHNCEHIHTLISRHLQRALYMPFRAHLFWFRVVLAQRLLKVKPFTSLPPMALLLRRFLIQIRITIKPSWLMLFFLPPLFCCRFEGFCAQSDLLLRCVAYAWARPSICCHVWTFTKVAHAGHPLVQRKHEAHKYWETGAFNGHPASHWTHIGDHGWG